MSEDLKLQTERKVTEMVGKLHCNSENEEIVEGKEFVSLRDLIPQSVIDTLEQHGGTSTSKRFKFTILIGAEPLESLDDQGGAQ